MESHKIKEAAEKYLESIAHENDGNPRHVTTDFTSGAEWHQSQTSNLSNKLKEQLEKWIYDCEAQSDVFLGADMLTSQISSQAMAQAYRNAITLIQK